MIYTPRYIIYWAVCNYITEEEELNIKNDIIKYKRLSDRNFLKIIERHFDIERFKDSPVIWEDIWLYNYIKYDFVKSRMLKKGLIVRYENRVVIKVKKEVFNLLNP